MIFKKNVNMIYIRYETGMYNLKVLNQAKQRKQPDEQNEYYTENRSKRIW